MSYKKNITNERIINFLRHIKNGGITASDIINDDLDKGQSLEEIFKKDAEGYGFSMQVRSKSENMYKIAFGCQVAPLAGDGGEWEVTFDDKDNVVDCLMVVEWIS